MALQTAQPELPTGPLSPKRAATPNSPRWGVDNSSVNTAINTRIGTDCQWRRRRNRRGAAMVYTIVVFAALCGICSLGVDWGHVQMVKNDLSRCSDATARAYMEFYNLYGMNYANANGPQLYSATDNPVDSGSGVMPTVSVLWGYWNTTSRTFSTSSNGGPDADKVTTSRTTANGNPVPLVWGRILGKTSCDVTVTSVAALIPGQSTNVNVPSTANPYFAGMPAGTTNSYGDTTQNNGAIQVSGVTVTPGTPLTFTNFTGTTTVEPGSGGVPYSGPAGDKSIPVHHGVNFNYTINNPGPENGFADAVMPEDSLMGVFLDDSAPDTTATPATVDWTNPSVLNQTTYNNIQLKQPFYIGTGMTTGNVVQQFVPPPGATRFFIAIWDGVCYNNNLGSLSGTVSVAATVQIVQ